MQFNRRETASLCAALTLLRETSKLPPSIHVIYTNGDQLMPLNDAELLELRDRIADSTAQQATTDFHLARTLAQAGFYAGPRDPSRNQNYPGAFMVAESLDVADTANAGTGGYCIVGDDLSELMRDAVEHHGLAG